jgi:glutathione S-transferase
MQFFFSPTSSYVRKVRVTAIEKGLEGRITPIRGNGGVSRRCACIISGL